MIYAFEDFELDTERYELRRGGTSLNVEPQVFSVLRYLVEHSDRVVSKQELLDQVWGTSFVSDAALTTRIMGARKALGDSGAEQRLIKTVPRRGYRFVGSASSSSPSAAQPEPERPAQVQFCRTSDGVRIAYSRRGHGRPFVKVANWLTHLEFDEQSPIWRHLLRALSSEFELVRYDERGNGLSDWDADDFSVEAWVRDLEAVVDAVGLESFPLLAISQGGAVAIAYAAKHPERVSHLILHNTYARGRSHRGPEGVEESEAVVTLTRRGWGNDGSAFAQMFSARLTPGGTAEQIRWLTELQRVSTSRENAVRFRQAFSELNVEHLLSDITAPTLVIHSRNDQAAPFEEGRRLAAGIPGARLVPLESENHLLLEHEPAWEHFRDEVLRFVAN